MLFSAFFVCCDAGLLLPLHYRQCVDAVSLALAEKLVLELFHCVKLSVYGLPLWNSHAVMALQTLVCNGSSSEKQAQTL